MKVTVTEPRSWKRVLEIEVPGAQIQEKVDSVYRKYRKKVVLPGFRKGKVPLDVLKARFDREIKAEVLEEVVPEFYEQAQNAQQIVPVSRPVIEDVKYEEGQPLRFRAAVEIKPAIDLKEYKGIRVLKRPVDVTDADVEHALEILRDRYADIVRVEGTAEEGHYLLADIQWLDATGIPIVGRKKENQFFRIGSDMLGEGLGERLVGIKAGEERRVTTVYPDDYEERRLAGREANYLVKVREVLDKQLPELDDDFAVDAGAESLDALKNAIRADLEKEPDREMRDRLVEQLVENNAFDVPESILTRYIDRLVADARKNTREPVDEEELRRQYRPIAIDQFKRYLILEEIAARENIAATKDEIDERLNRIAERTGTNVDALRRAFRDDGRLERIESEIREDKVIEFLVGQADIQVG